MPHDVESIIDIIDDKINRADGETIAAVARLLGIKIVYIGENEYDEPLFEDEVR